MFQFLHYKANKWINPIFVRNSRTAIQCQIFQYCKWQRNFDSFVKQVLLYLLILEKNCLGILIFFSYISRKYKSLMPEIPLLCRHCIANRADTKSYGYLRQMAVIDESNPS